MDKGTINIFEVKLVRKEIGFKISAADVFNEFLYLGDEKGNIHAYPIRAGEADVISKNDNQTVKNVSKSKIDKILCYKEISTILILTGETLLALDSSFKRQEVLGSKIADFAINESFDRELATYSVVAITRKKQGLIFVYDQTQRKLVEVNNKFSVSEVPNGVAYNGKYIILATKKDYESLNMQNKFALKKSPLQAKFPFVRAVAPNEIICFTDDLCLTMSPQFEPKQKDTLTINNLKPVQQIAVSGSYCFALTETALFIYLNTDKKFSLLQEIPVNVAKGVTNNRPFIYNRDDLYFLYEIPYETQIKALLDRCKVDEAISLLIQKVGPDNEQKIEQLKIDGIWPLLKKTAFDRAKEYCKASSIDIRELILLYPELQGLQISELFKQVKVEKAMATIIKQFINEKAQKGKDDQTILKTKSKFFIKEILEFKRDFYLSQGVSNKIKKSFARSRYSFIKGPLPSATSEELLEIIDYTLIRWYLDMGMFGKLEQDFLLKYPLIYCQKYFTQFEDYFKQNSQINEKFMQVPTLKPRLFAAFDKNDKAFQIWRNVAEASQRDQIIKVACEEAVNLLAKFEDKNGIEQKLDWILRLRPQIAMTIFKKIPLNFFQSDNVIKKFEKDKNDKYLQLYLETVVIDNNTEIEAYHTKLMLLYLDNLFKLNPKENKEEGKSPEFLEKLQKFRKLEKNPNSRYASEAVLKKIDKCQWLLEDEIYLYSREKRHEQALKRYINKNMNDAAVKYCQQTGEQTLTIYFKMVLTMYKSYESSKNNSALLLKKDISIFLAEHASSSELDPLTVLELIPDDWMLNESESIGGIYQFLESAITHTLHQKRSTYTAKYLSEMDLLNVEYSLVQAKKAYLRFNVKKKCCICGNHIADKFFVVYPNANVCHQACVKKDKNSNTVCPVTKQDFQKTFKY